MERFSVAILTEVQFNGDLRPAQGYFQDSAVRTKGELLEILKGTRLLRAGEERQEWFAGFVREGGKGLIVLEYSSESSVYQVYYGARNHHGYFDKIGAASRHNVGCEEAALRCFLNEMLIRPPHGPRTKALKSKSGRKSCQVGPCEADLYEEETPYYKRHMCPKCGHWAYVLLENKTGCSCWGKVINCPNCNNHEHV